MKQNLLRTERKRRGWSQAKLAEALGVDISTVRRWERGRVVPYPYHQRKMAILFAKSPEELGLPWYDENTAKMQVSHLLPNSVNT